LDGARSSVATGGAPLRDASFSSLSYDNNPVKALLHVSTLVAGEGLIGMPDDLRNL
jgi:hypothetical protein